MFGDADVPRFCLCFSFLDHSAMAVRDILNGVG
jgi:hypothetical protein